MVFIAGSSLLGNSLLHSTVRQQSSLYSKDITVAENIEIVCQFQEYIWETLSISERLAASQVIANIERGRLGISTPLTIEADSLSESGYGYYDDRTYRIVLNIDYLLYGSAEETLDTLCHEAFHAFEHRLVDAYDSLDDSSKDLMIFSTAVKYKEEFTESSHNFDYFDYFFSNTEIDARNYAERSVDEYYQRIDEYVANMNQ